MHNFELKMCVCESDKFFEKLPEFNHSMYGASVVNKHYR